MKSVKVWTVAFEGQVTCNVIAHNPEHAIKVAREGRKSEGKTDASSVPCISVTLTCTAYMEP